MAVPFSNTKLRVPRGFQNLLEGLAKEVLRNQPDNINAFAAIYFDNLLKIRAGELLRSSPSLGGLYLSLLN